VAEIGINSLRAAELLRESKLVGIPTETVYGLAANALDEKAVLSIFETKNRPFFDPLIVHVPSLQEAKRYAIIHDVRLETLAKTFWPGPLTLLLQKKEIIPDLVTSGLTQVAVRVPNHPLTLELLNKLDFPLAAPSANPFGYVSPTEAEHVNKQLGDKIAYILDGGPCGVGLESTIVGIEDGKVCVFRLGGLAVETIEKLIGKVELRINNSSDPKAPGQLKNHYAPKKPLFIGNINDLLKKYSPKKVAIICYGPDITATNALTFNLSLKKDHEEAAINLFKFLRLADESSAELVICEFLPEDGLGLAINDRLRRASVN
jgi:L-threonylcarbamoyladenylate synthase